MTDVKVPGLGKMPKGAVIAVAIGGGLVVFLVVRNYRKGSASQTSSSSGTDNVDPATGYAYGSAGDTAALAAQAGTSGSGIDPMTGYPVGSAQDEQALASEGYSGYSAGYPIGDGTTSVGVPYPTAPTTNAQWSQQVQQTLTGIGYGSEAVAGAVGAYLAKLPLTSNQATIIRVAIAEDGPPPQGSYSIVVQPGGGSGGGTTTKVTVPNVVGMQQDQAFQVLSSIGLKAEGPAPVKGKVHIVTAESPKAGTSVNRGSAVKLTSKLK